MSDRTSAGRLAYRKRFYKVGEVAELTELEPHVLRYWETEFPRLRPGKSSGGQRLYTPDDIELILEIKDLVHHQGFTIAGARKRLRAVRAARRDPDGAAPSILDALGDARREIRAILTMMDANDKE